MSDVAPRGVKVPRWAESPCPFEQAPDTKGMMVASGTVPELPDQSETTTGAGFANGRALLEDEITIYPVHSSVRPRVLYHVEHDGHGVPGMQARGCGVFRAIPIFFQIWVQKHLNWGFRGRSPFMSVTTSWKKAVATAASYARLWNVQYLLSAFRLKHLVRFYDDEYLVENFIPPEAITELHMWDRCKEWMDPDHVWRNKAWAKMPDPEDKEARKRKHEEEEEPSKVPKDDQPAEDVEGSEGSRPKREMSKRTKKFQRVW